MAAELCEGRSQVALMAPRLLVFFTLLIESKCCGPNYRFKCLILLGNLQLCTQSLLYISLVKPKVVKTKKTTRRLIVYSDITFTLTMMFWTLSTKTSLWLIRGNGIQLASNLYHWSPD